MKGSVVKFVSLVVLICRVNMLFYLFGKFFFFLVEGNGGGSVGKLMKVWEIRVSFGEGCNRLVFVFVLLLGLVIGVFDFICGRRESINKCIMFFGVVGYRFLVVCLGFLVMF